jgi:cadmium resistance protein CadD (predicted permease)
MSEILVIVGVTAGAFVGTNLDNLLLLVAMYSRYEQRAWTVTAGYIAGMILIGVIALAIGEVGEWIPLAYLGLLGVIPVIMGMLSLWKLFRRSPSTETAKVAVKDSGVAIFLALAGVQLSNGADSIITFSALYADSSDPSDYLIAPTFLAMACVFSGVAFYLVKNPRLGRYLSHYGQYVTPFILIFVGLYILSNTASDLVPGV